MSGPQLKGATASTARTSANPWARQASANASLLERPSVAVEPLGARFRVTLAGQEPAAGTGHPAGLGQAGVDVLPVVHDGDGPDDGGDGVVEGDCLRAAVHVADAGATEGQRGGDAPHHAGWIDANGGGAEARRSSDGRARTAAEVDHGVLWSDAGAPRRATPVIGNRATACNGGTEPRTRPVVAVDEDHGGVDLVEPGVGKG